jgi:acyl carrier protein
MAQFERSDTKQQIIEIAVDKLGKDSETIEQASTFQEMGVDSLDMVELTMKLEDHFGIEIDDVEAEKLTSIDMVVDYVHQRRTK